jgi:arylsulfatase
MGNFDQDRWELFHTDVDRSEAHDVAAEHPEMVEQLKALWLQEAQRNNVLPLNDLMPTGNPADLDRVLKMIYHVPVPPSGQYTYFPGTSDVPESSAANTHGRSYKVLAEVDLAPDSEGVIFAQGARFSGHAMYIKDGRLLYLYNYAGIKPEYRVSAPITLTGRHILGVEFTKTGVGEHHEAIGPARLYIDDDLVDETEIRTIPALFSLCGEGLCIGYDSGDAVSSDYAGSRFEFTNGEIVKVVFDVADDAYVDVERYLAAAMARD